MQFTLKNSPPFCIMVTDDCPGLRLHPAATLIQDQAHLEVLPEPDHKDLLVLLEQQDHKEFKDLRE